MAQVVALGQRHTSYGVIAEHYALVEQALPWAMAEQLGERWTEDLATAWRSANTPLADTK